MFLDSLADHVIRRTSRLANNSSNACLTSAGSIIVIGCSIMMSFPFIIEQLRITRMPHQGKSSAGSAVPR